LVTPLSRLFFGIAVGWLVVSQILLRNPEKRQYKLAVKALRKNKYGEAIEQMNELIAQEPDAPEHYAFRAQLHRLHGDLAQAEADYRQTIQLLPQSPLGPNGLSEVYLQRGDLTQARQWADQAYQLAPKEWVVVYNLGMLAERQGEDKPALKYLRQALDLGIPESRHRLMAQLWIARICHRGGKKMDAEIALVALRKERKGMHEWKVTLESAESQPLRAVFQQDVRLAQALMEGRSLSDVFTTA
jgi:tetratricopeptide (TPR) repeat protein